MYENKDELIRYYQEEIARLERKLAIRDRILFNQQIGESHESREPQGKTFQEDSTQD